MNVADPSDGHIIVHDLFHNLTHSHLNAPFRIRTQIDGRPGENQEPGHKAAGGIFIYRNDVTNTWIEDISQGNIQDVLLSVPEYKKKKESKPSLTSGQSIFGGIP